MKVTSFEQLSKHKSKALFLVNAKEEDLLAFVQIFLKKWPLKIASVHAVLDDLSFFAENKVFVIPDAEKLKGSEVELLQKVSTPMLFIAKGMRANYPLYTWIDSAGICLDLTFEKKAEKEKRFVDLILALCTARQKKIESSVAFKLYSQVGPDPYLLEQEVEKLSLYTGERPQILAEEVAKVASYTKEESVWEFLDALLQKNKAQALYLGKKLVRGGESIFPLLRQIRTQIQTYFQVALLLESPEQIQARFPYMKGMILQQHMNVARQFGRANFKRALLITDEIDLMSRGVIEDPEFLIELLVAKL